MGLDNLHRTTLDVICIAAWHFAGASFLITVLFALFNNTGVQTVGQQMISAVFTLSLFLGIGTAVRMWWDQRQSRRREERLVREGQRA